ncbi:MAG: GGDEF domain-containing protein [Acidobacteriota bacterium]
MSGRLALLLCGALLLAAGALTSAQAGDLQGAARTGSITPAAMTVNSRVLLGGATLVIAGILVPLYFYRRRNYILYWVAGWSLSAVSALLIAHEFSHKQVGYAVYGLSQFVGILSALVFVVSADAYRTGPRLRRAYAVVLLPVLLWFVMAPVVLGPEAVFVPGHLLMTGGFAAAALAHLALYRQTRLLGAGVVGAMMLLIAGSNAWVVIEVGGPGAPAGGRLFVSIGIYLFTALGMQLMTFEDMTYELRTTNKRLESAQSELRQMVTTDALTGCRNRRFFGEIIDREIQRRRRYNIPLSLLFVDIDRFKAINDTFGHEAGDQVLQRVAEFLIHNVREADCVFRWGGDEFLILISCREEEAVSKAKELQAAFAGSAEADSMPSGLGLSVGCAEVRPDTTDIMAVVKTADERMYLDKRR